jgi:hypothetical protein
MNQYTEVLYYIKGLAQADDYVNTVTRGEFDKLDLNKGNIFPLVHINIASAGFTNGSTITFDVQVGCLDIRDINKEVVEDKFWEQDNEVDNLNETLACLNRIWTIMYRDFNDVGITASESPTLEPMIMADKNLLDGWIIDFTIEVPNSMLNLCND